MAKGTDWHLLKRVKPPTHTRIWVAFLYKEKRWASDTRREVKLCQYTPNYIVPLCEEDEGSWRGLGSTDCEAAWAWRLQEPEVKYPIELEKSNGKSNLET